MVNAAEIKRQSVGAKQTRLAVNLRPAPALAEDIKKKELGY
jgi:hypothetical protein